MNYELRYSNAASKQLQEIQFKDAAKHRKVVKCLRKLANDPRHPGLNSHKFSSMIGPNGEDVWESYVENNTPAAWRVFWVYGPDERRGSPPSESSVSVVTVVAITPHP